LTPLAKLEVAADEEKRALEIVVDAFVMLNNVVVAYASEEEPISREPATERKVQCLRLVPPFMSVKVSWPRKFEEAEVVATCKSH